MLHAEMVLTKTIVLLLLSRGAHTLPQTWAPLTANITSRPILTPLSITIVPGSTHIEISEASFGSGGNGSMGPEECTDSCTFDCATEGCLPFPVQNEIPTASGFENTNTDNNGRTISTIAARPASNTNVVTTSTQLLIGIHTSVAQTATRSRPADTNVQPPPKEQSTQTWEQEGPNAPEVTSSNSLLVDIISIVARPVPNRSSPSNNEVSPDNENPQQAQQTMPVSDLSMTAAPGAQPTVQLGQSITLGGATLTLTPGLSTTLGTGPAATYIEIVSDTAGQTIITLSTSGTAVIATVTNAPTIITLTSDFEASVTSAETRGDSGSFSALAPTSTSSIAGAVHLKDGSNWTIHLLLVFIGMGVAL